MNIHDRLHKVTGQRNLLRERLKKAHRALRQISRLDDAERMARLAKNALPLPVRRGRHHVNVAQIDIEEWLDNNVVFMDDSSR